MAAINDVVILCGGRGTRLQEHTQSIPKPLVEIGGEPILWHVIQIYAAQGFDRFVLCTGYKGELIERFVPSGRGRRESTVALRGHRARHADRRAGSSAAERAAGRALVLRDLRRRRRRHRPGGARSTSTATTARWPR